jgi:3-oxoacyl-[acyl-carrier protein] reductase
LVHARCDVIEGKNDCHYRCGAQGIGQAIATLAIGLGARVVGIDINGDKLGAFAATMSGQLLSYVGSVADPEFTEATVRDVKARIGDIHGLVNNAGITRPAMIEKMTLQQWSEVISVHLTGAFLWTQAVGRVMVAQGKAGRESAGSIVNIASDAGRAGSIGTDQLCRSKKRPIGRDHECRQGMVKVRRSDELRLLRRCRDRHDRNDQG